MNIRRGKRDTLINHPDSPGARVTRINGAWGYWSQGRRTGPFRTREEAEAGALEKLEALMRGERS